MNHLKGVEFRVGKTAGCEILTEPISPSLGGAQQTQELDRNGTIYEDMFPGLTGN